VAVELTGAVAVVNRARAVVPLVVGPDHDDPAGRDEAHGDQRRVAVEHVVAEQTVLGLGPDELVGGG
jgi:hypothetical protein